MWDTFGAKLLDDSSTARNLFPFLVLDSFLTHTKTNWKKKSYAHALMMMHIIPVWVCVDWVRHLVINQWKWCDTMRIVLRLSASRRKACCCWWGSYDVDDDDTFERLAVAYRFLGSNGVRLSRVKWCEMQMSREVSIFAKDHLICCKLVSAMPHNLLY